MSFKALTEAELDFINDTLLSHGSDDSIVDISELDGFLTAVISGHNLIQPSQWFPELWGGNEHEPTWSSEDDMQRFYGLVIQHMNNNISVLMDCPQHFEAIFNVSAEDTKEETLIVDGWCFGYMHGVNLGRWGELPEEVETSLNKIALHGKEENYDLLDTFSKKDWKRSIAEIQPAACELHAYFLAQRSPAAKPVKVEKTAGRNDPCPCGSGKKFKKCCLQ